jgi:uncharacterized protein YndB with AHSA1/START domain
MLIPVLGGVAVVAASTVAWIASRPAAYRYERSIHIAVPAATAWALISDFRNFSRWSPWQKMDPSMTTTFAGTAGQPGARYDWSGNKKVGRGRMEVVAVEAGTKLDIALEFFEPFQSRSDTSWVVEEADGGCRVRWIMSGTNNFMAKAFDAFMNMEKLLSRDFDEGLANLKRELEADASAS